MSIYKSNNINEFRFNKRRKHFSYIFHKNGKKRKNLLLSTKACRFIKNVKHKNIELNRHPNKNESKKVYIIPRVYSDDIKSFGRKLNDWTFSSNDKRKVEQLLKYKK